MANCVAGEEDCGISGGDVLPLPAKVVSLVIGNLEATMGDTDKNIVEKLVDTINDVVETVTTTAADALSDAMEPDQIPERDKAKEIKEDCEKDRQGNN
jgi:hypothetical protein